jgi:tRNA (guanine26-N2/guanine27-N2)-dimethyltransferase
MIILIIQSIIVYAKESFILMISEDFTESIEGNTRLLVPAASLINKVPPKTPAFFNPAAKLNRDISILIYRTFISECKHHTKSFADAFSGIGARALRVAVEVPEIEIVYLNDINILAIEAAKKAAELNGVEEKCYYSVNEVCKFLSQHSTKNGERFTIIDLDPFGTPAPFVDCVLRSILDDGLISITATDTTVLCGVYPVICCRRYYGRSLNTNYTNEIALRLVISLIALTAARLDLAIEPIFVHANLHYLRIYVKVFVSSSKANKVYDNIGYLRHCFRCGNRNIVERHMMSEACDICGNSFSVAGQMWINKLFDKDFIGRLLSHEPINNGTKGKYMMDRSKKPLSICMHELDDIPFYFRGDEIASKLRINPYSLQTVIEKLSASGYRASKTSFNPSGFKTNARIDEILDVLRK